MLKFDFVYGDQVNLRYYKYRKYSFRFNDKDGLSKIVLTLDEYIFLIASDIRYVEVRILMPLLSPDMAGEVNILYMLKYFVLSCIDC